MPPKKRTTKNEESATKKPPGVERKGEKLNVKRSNQELTEEMGSKSLDKRSYCWMETANEELCPDTTNVLLKVILEKKTSKECIDLSLMCPTAAIRKEKHAIDTVSLKTGKNVIDKPHVRELMFPPCLFTNVEYQNGIRLHFFGPNDVKTNQDIKTSVGQYIIRSYNASVILPALTPTESTTWIHKSAANEASLYKFPVQAYRFVGVISRTISYSLDSKCSFDEQKFLRGNNRHQWCNAELYRSKKSKKTKTTTKVVNDQNNKNTSICRKMTFDSKSGVLIPSAVNDNDYIPVTDLLLWLQHIQRYVTKKQETQCSQTNFVIDELVVIINACLDLCNPRGLWNVPLVTVYPILVKLDDPCKSNTRTWKIEIGVFINRLLPETTTTTLRTVMNALDPSSYRVTVPLYQNHGGNIEPSFESSLYPIVCINDATSAQSFDEQIKEKKKDTIDQCFHDLNDMSKDGSKISAFTIPGLMKLLENHGSDISEWKTNIAPKLRKDFKLEFMLHQQHGICWMLQMEQIVSKGALFGINSILWEEREFVDGGKYYYSPAIGQLRLDPPHKDVVGGLLCDEMGCGKTIEVLGLIVATLDDLKEEAQNSALVGCNTTHSSLIIVPPVLVSQWLSEIVKTTGNALVVDFIDHNSGNLIRRCRKGRKHVHSITSNLILQGDADITICTYKALRHPSPPHVHKYIESRRWGRVILDEMQEIRSSTTQIAKACSNLSSYRRWMLSGTPLFDGIDDLKGELNFLCLEPFAAQNEDGFFNFAISQPWQRRDVFAIEILKALSLVMLRRSKSMTICGTDGQKLMGQNHGLTVEYVPVPQKLSERALYYFLEYVVANELSRHQMIEKTATQSDENETMKGSRSENERKKSRAVCLRLLRELCNSPVLLSGGHGSRSQLSILNTFLVDQARIQSNATSRSDPLTDDNRSMCIDEAIVHLAQIKEAGRTGEGEVSFLQLGFGQGVTRRVRATDSIEEKMKNAKETLKRAELDYISAKVKNAKALWSIALEKVTTGNFKVSTLSNVSVVYRNLWSWRSIFAAGKLVSQSSLGRGWRPSTNIVTTFHLRNPSYLWAQPGCLLLRDIPSEISNNDILDALKSNSDIKLHQISTTRSSDGDTWNAYLSCKNEDDSDYLLQKASVSNGIVVSGITPSVEERIKSKQAQYDEIVASFSLHPTDARKKERLLAKKELQRAKLGLRIVQEHNLNDWGDIIIKNARTEYRSDQKEISLDLLERNRDEFRKQMTTSSLLIVSQERILINLKSPSEIALDVQATSAFDALLALSAGHSERTQCPICLESLGSSCFSNGVVALTKCGHLYCSQCLKDHVINQPASKCPSCRKRFDVKDVAFVDSSKQNSTEANERRQRAKDIVQNAAEMLLRSDGQLDPHMWEQLYLAIEIPLGENSIRDCRVTGIPGEFLAHLRRCTGMDVINGPNTGRLIEVEFLSSKVNQLLSDLPRNELSVVFSSSINTIKHLQFVFEKMGIGYRSLYTGQEATASEQAVADWQNSKKTPSDLASTIACPVLLVQAGAAASGLTLTASCKMFLMEPFLRYEEEQQAYARCYRYGQMSHVHCKCYYTPVSIESRLLEWRKQSQFSVKEESCESSSKSNEPHFVYESKLLNEEDVNGDNKENEMEQTAFLLGLHKTNEQDTLSLHKINDQDAVIGEDTTVRICGNHRRTPTSNPVDLPQVPNDRINLVESDAKKNCSIM